MGTAQWQSVCSKTDLVEQSGVAVLASGEAIAIFYLPSETPPLYAVSHFDPVSEANVIARGIIGDVNGELVVASPVYKQHFSLCDGRCLEKPEHRLKVWPVRLQGDAVELQLPLSMTSAA